MMLWIITQSNDVVVDFCILHTVKEVCQYAGLGCTLAMDDNLRVGTLLATGLTSFLQQIEETSPVGIRTIGVTAISSRSFDSPQHTIADLVTRLDEVGCGASILQLLQTIFGVLVNLFVEFGVRQRLPCIGSPLLPWVCPCVAIVEVEHESHSLVFDALTQSLDVFKVLTNGLVVV